MRALKNPGISKTWSETDNRKSEVGIGYPDSLWDLFLKTPWSKEMPFRRQKRRNVLLVRSIMEATFTPIMAGSLVGERQLAWPLRTLRKKPTEGGASSNREKSE